MFWLPLLVAIAGGAYAQLTAQTSVAPEIRECYLDPVLMNRNNLPPTTIQVLIDIIQKIEDTPDNVNLNLRQISALLLHTYRQDGIEYHQPEISLPAGSNVLPYAPTFHAFHRHRLVLTRLIPSNNFQVLPNTTLNSPLKCAIHHMLSTTVDARVRGDESSCSSLSQYRALRNPRSVNDDVEILNLHQMQSATHGNMRQYNPNDDVEYSNYDTTQYEKQLLGESQCPLLDGVVSTSYGAVSMGNVIAGIAAGAEPQRVPVVELAKGSVMNYNNVQQTVLNIFPATLSGDLAEAVLIQGTERGSPTISIGSAGGWNSSQAHRHFMLQGRVNIEMTDPEIRGDIDGYLLGSKITTILNTYSSLRLSQLLDMYYSSRNGVYQTSFQAGYRKELTQQNLNNNELVSETYAFAAALDTNMPLRGTIIGGLEELVNSAVNNFHSYTTNTLNDPSNGSGAGTLRFRQKTNLYIALDSSWSYPIVYQAISYLVENIEVGKFGSSITLLSAFDGSVIVDTTFSPAEFHSNYTFSRHQLMPTGMNLQTSLTNIRYLMQESLRNESLRNYVGGNATVLLYLLNSGTVDNNEGVWEQARQLNNTVPDLRIIFATATNQFDNLWNLVRDMHNDIKTISLTSSGTDLNNQIGPVLERIQQTGRRIVNPLCGSQFTPASSGSRQLEDFIEPGYTNFYAVSPNYFYEKNDNRKLRVSRSSSGVGSLIVCHSRWVAQPTSNSTVDQSTVVCQTLAASGNVEIALQNPCDGYTTINSCPPLYVSVESNVVGSTDFPSTCTDNKVCRFPYNMRFQIQIEEFGCYSGASGVKASLGFILFVFIVTFLKNL